MTDESQGTQEEPRVTALAPWFGSKRNLAPEIVAAIGPHRVYWEPFCGSCAVLLAKPPCVMETAVDLHGDLINLARVLKSEDSAVDLYGRLSRTIFHEGIFLEAKELLQGHRGLPCPDEPNIDRAEAFMVCSWHGRNGVIGTANNNNSFCVRYTANGGHAAKRWLSAIESIPAWHHRLRYVTFLNRDAFEVLDRIDDVAGTAIYLDPPYLIKKAKYVHDFADADHTRLAEALARFRSARVVVSYYDHPRLEVLYPGWQKLTFAVTKSLTNQGKRDREGADKAVEVLLVNDRQNMMF